MLSTDLPHERKPVPTALKNVDIVWCWVLGVRCLAKPGKGCKWQKKRREDLDESNIFRHTILAKLRRSMGQLF